MDIDELINVHVRVRPLNEQERSRGDQECVHVGEDGRTVRFVQAPTPSVQGRVSGNGIGAASVRALVFDSALAGSSQAAVFECTQTAQLLRDALSGYTVTVFAYGQTGSGKVQHARWRSARAALCRSTDAPPLGLAGSGGRVCVRAQPATAPPPRVPRFRSVAHYHHHEYYVCALCALVLGPNNGPSHAHAHTSPTRVLSRCLADFYDERTRGA